MQLVIVSFDAHALNDSSFGARFVLPVEPSAQAAGIGGLVARPHYSPVYTYKTRSALYLPIYLQLKGTVATQIDTLKTWFDTFDDSVLKKLLVKDTANSDKQWYVMATCVTMSFVGKQAAFTLLVPDPVWLSETETTNTWSITASGQTNAITPGGNVSSFPKFRIKPTSAKTAGFVYKRWAKIYNQTARAFANYPLDITNGGMDTAALVADTTRSVQINQLGGIDAAMTTIPYDTETGTFPTSGDAYVGTEQFSYTGKTATDLTGCTRGVNGTTAATHADDVVVYFSKIQADGDDLRVYVDGVEANRWLQGMNTATTKIWITASWLPKQQMTLRAAMGAGALTTIVAANIPANITAMKAAPIAGILLVESEAFTYTGKNIPALTFTGVTRAAKGTTAATHVINSVVRWIEHDIWVLYGNSAMAAPVTDDTRKPIFLLTSTNTSWDYDEFNNDDGLRAGAWKPGVLKSTGKESITYSGNQTADADPATEMGMSIKAWQLGNNWRAETAAVEWRLYHPAGATTVSSSGEKKRTTTTWPVTAALQKSLLGVTWANAWNEATPASIATWTAWTHASTALGATYYYLRFVLGGGQPATADAQADFEVEDVTLTLASANTPSVTLNTEQVNYELDATLTNNLTGEYITIKQVMEINQTLEIDTLNKTATFLLDNSNALAAMALSTVRFDWLPMTGGVSNTFQFDDTGTAGVELKTLYQDRNN